MAPMRYRIGHCSTRCSIPRAARPGCPFIMAAASAWVSRSMQAWSSSVTARRLLRGALRACSGTILPRASCATPTPGTISRSTVRGPTGCDCRWCPRREPMRLAMEFRAGQISLPALRQIYAQPTAMTVSAHDRERVIAAVALVDAIVERGQAAYGINTGFGLLAQTRIPTEQLDLLQRNLVLSHAAGVGEALPDAVVRLILALKINSLAHLSATLIGVGEVRLNGQMLPAAEGLRRAGLAPIKLRPKEGLALINGTQVSTSLALAGLFGAEDLWAAAVLSGAMSVDALKGSDVPFDERIQQSRGQPGQIEVARAYRALLSGSAIRASHLDCSRVQDPYSFRCQPQVMGACLDLISNCAATLQIEANAVTDNPLLFVDQGEVLSGGNFHAEPIAFVADTLADLKSC